MGCPQCQHDNRPGAKFCDECGCLLPRLWPQPAIGSARSVGRPRRKSPPARRREIAAAIGAVATGLGVISGIVIASPGWQRIIASWRETSAARAAMALPASATATEQATPPSMFGVAVGSGLVADPLGLQRAATVLPGLPSHLAPDSVSPPSAPMTPTQAPDAQRPTDRTPTGAQADAAQVMASLLIAQLGQDPAWRTALANADAHAPDSPEHAYWRSVATAIRDGGHRSRP